MTQANPAQADSQNKSGSPTNLNSQNTTSMSTQDAHRLVRDLEANIASVLLGKPEPIRLVVVALVSKGHVLVEDAPGVGKTSLAKALARSLGCGYTRLQCTPDMLPSDILGSSIYRPNSGDFEFRKGPIFTNVLLADEINRTTPRTQSSLLEAMNEYQASIEGTTYPLDRPFFVIATQNPFEYEGTYPLPENQLDRFTICTDIGYPERAVELEVLANRKNGEMVDQIKPVMTGEQLVAIQDCVQQVAVDPAIDEYILDLVTATRNHPELDLGTSTRGALTLHAAVQGLAFVENRDYATPDDVKRLAQPVLAHRVVCRGMIREGQRQRAQQVIQQILDETTTPR